MKILIVVATAQEIEPSLEWLQSHGIDTLVTGVGMLSTVYTLTKKLQSEQYDVVINVGVGGILDQNLRLGEVYRITQDEVFQFGAEDRNRFIPIEELGFGRSVFSERLPNVSIHHSIPIKIAQGITVNAVHGSEDSIRYLRQNYPDNLVESMEGAAVFFVAGREQLPVLQFRAISNYIEPRNRETWEMGLAIRNLHAFLRDFLARIA